MFRFLRALLKDVEEAVNMDDIGLFLDHWLIARRDGDTILNGTPENFEESLRTLVRASCIQALSAADDVDKYGRGLLHGDRRQNGR